MRCSTLALRGRSGLSLRIPSVTTLASLGSRQANTTFRHSVGTQPGEYSGTPPLPPPQKLQNCSRLKALYQRLGCGAHTPLAFRRRATPIITTAPDRHPPASGQGEWAESRMPKKKRSNDTANRCTNSVKYCDRQRSRFKKKGRAQTQDVLELERADHRRPALQVSETAVPKAD
jgi:hypothetical protein